MLTDNDKINTSQAVIFLLSVILGTGILDLPRTAAKSAGPDGWLLIILAGVFTFCGSLFTASLIKRYPQDTLVEFSEKLVGKFFSTIIVLVFIIIWSSMTAFTVRNFSGVMNTYMLERTPKEFIILTQMILAVYLIRHGIEPMARVFEVMLPVKIIPIIIMYLIAIPSADFTELLPFMQVSLSEALGCMWKMSFSFLGFDTFLMLGPYLAKPDHSKRIMFFGIFSSMIIYLFITVVVFAVLGVADTKIILWPTMSIIRSIKIPGGIFERFDAVILALWTIASFTTICIGYYVASSALSHLIKAEEVKYTVTLLFPWIFLVSILPGNVLEVLNWGRKLGVINMTLSISIPALLYFISIFKDKRGKTS